MSAYFTAALAWLRASTSTLTREQIYGVATLVLVGSGIVSGVDDRLEAALINTVTAGAVLLLAAINSRPLMALLYVALGSVAGLGQVVAVVYDGATWTVWVGYAAGLLGTVLAFFRVPTAPPVALPAVSSLVRIEPVVTGAFAASAFDDVTAGLKAAAQSADQWAGAYLDPASGGELADRVSALRNTRRHAALDARR